MLMLYFMGSDTSRVISTPLNAMMKDPFMGFEVDLMIKKPLQTRIQGAGLMVA